MGKLKVMINESKDNYERLVDSQVELGGYLCELLREVIPEIKFQVGDYDMGMEYIRLEVPRESPRYRLKYTYEEQRCKFVDLDIDSMLKEGGVEAQPIDIDDCIIGVTAEEREKIRQIILNELRREG